MPHPCQRTIHRVLLRFIHLLLLMALPGSCATLDQIIQKPTASFDSLRITNADLVQSTAIFNFNVINPNPIGLKIGRITYNLKLNGHTFVNGQLERGITLPAGSNSTLQVPITMPYLDFFKSAAQLYKTRKANYALSGGLDVGPFTIPFQAHGSLNLPKMPKITLEAIEVRRFSPLGAALNCRLQIDNPNAFDFLFKRLEYDLSLAGTPFAKASALPQGTIKRQSSSVVDLSFDVSFTQLGGSAYRLLQGGKTEYTLNGGLIFSGHDQDERKIPFHLSGRVPFLR